MTIGGIAVVVLFVAGVLGFYSVPWWAIGVLAVIVAALGLWSRLSGRHDRR